MHKDLENDNKYNYEKENLNYIFYGRIYNFIILLSLYSSYPGITSNPVLQYLPIYFNKNVFS